jgi:lipopolysaccharide assembly outer membrane protein LptD (OstA)
VEDPDVGTLGDTFLFIAPVGDAKDQHRKASVSFIEKSRAKKGLSGPVAADTGAVAVESLEEEPLATDEVRFTVDEEEGWIEYLVKDDTVVLYNDARVAYQDMVLTAEEIRYISEKDLVIAEGRAVLEDGQDVHLGERMAYDLELERGVVYEGTTEAVTGFYKGRKIKKTGEKIICAEWGSFSTCELANPHYRFWSPKLKIYLDDKVVARPAVIFGGDVPAAAIPYYFFSLRRDRHSGFLPPYIRYYRGGSVTVNNGFYWAINDFSDATFYLDYNSGKGWRKAAQYVYKYGSRSTINSVYASHQRERDTYIDWWKIYANHRQDINDTTVALAHADIRNSVYYDDYFNEDFEVRTQEDLETFFNLSKTWTDVQLSVDARHTEYTQVTEEEDDTGEGTETIESSNDVLPRINLYMTRKELYNTSLYYQVSGYAANYYEDGENTLRKGNFSGSLSRPTRVLRHLQVEPTLSVTDDVYDRDIYGRNLRNLFLWSTSTAFSTKVYGIFPIRDAILRHIVNPTVTHYYRPKSDQKWLVGGAGTSPGHNYLSWHLHQAFDVKMPPKKTEGEKEGEEPGGTEGGETNGETENGTPWVVNLATLDVSASYNLDDLVEGIGGYYRMTDRGPEYHRLSDVTSSLELTPNFADWYYLSSRVSTVHDVHLWMQKSFSVATTFSLTTAGIGEADEETGYGWENARDPYGNWEDPAGEDYEPGTYDTRNVPGRRYGAGEGMGRGWTFSVSHNYTKGNSGVSDLHSLRGAVAFDLTKKWRLGYDVYYDVAGNELVSEHYRIYRNLHRWEAEFRVSFEQTEVIYWFQIRLTDIPEIQYLTTRQRQF